jgi:hypothetical protein
MIVTTEPEAPITNYAIQFKLPHMVAPVTFDATWKSIQERVF